MMNLDSILDAVASGRLSPKNAELQIKAMMAGEEIPALQDREGIKGAFDRLKKNVHLDEFLKKGSDVMHQISENMHKPFDKLTLPSNLNNFAFSSHMEGIDYKFSLFRAVSLSEDSKMLANHVIGSQWYGVNVKEASELKDNRFTAIQLSEVDVTKSHFNDNNLSLCRLSNFAVQDSQMNDNKISRSTLSDVSLAEADFTSNRISKSTLAQTMFNESRVTNTTFQGCDIKDCEFESCDLQGITFENCSFHECTFSRVKLISLEKTVVRNHTVVGKMLSNCKTVEAFLEALAEPAEEKRAAATKAGPAPVEVPKKEAVTAKAKNTRAGAVVVKKSTREVSTEQQQVETPVFQTENETTSSPS